MSELSVRQYLHNDGSGLTCGYDKREADKFIADLEESHKKEVGQLLIEIAELKKKLTSTNKEYKMNENKQVEHGFDWAIQQLKAGRKVQRKGWNGKGMFLTLQEGSTVHGELMRNAPAKEFYTGKLCNINAHIDMKAADDTYVVGWLASQTDMLADDWQIAE